MRGPDAARLEVESSARGEVYQPPTGDDKPLPPLRRTCGLVEARAPREGAIKTPFISEKPAGPS
jgi:hypothetical protein